MEIQRLIAPALAPVGGGGAAAPASGVESFGKMLGDAVASLQQTQGQADQMAGALATGQNVDLHDVMLAMEGANLATQLTVQVRNKLVEAYQEISRMPV